MGRLITVNNQYFDDAGAPLSGGKIYFYSTGGLTAKATYSDSGLTTPNTNPVVLDAYGRCGDIFFDGPARVVVKTSADVLIDDIDPVYGQDSGAERNPYQAWSGATTYGQDDIVVGSDAKIYRSIAGSNLNNDPTGVAGYWSEAALVYIWDASRTYKTNELAYRSGRIYRSKVGSNTNNDPPSSAAQWENLSFTGDMDGAELILDADGDTSLQASTDDQIDVKIAGADDFLFIANIFRALSGSQIQADTINETTSAAGVTIDGLLIKDGGITNLALSAFKITHQALGTLTGGTGGSAQSLNLALYNSFSATISTATQEFTFDSVPTGQEFSFSLYLTNPGSQTLTFPAGVDWDGGVAPPWTVSGTDIVTFTTIDDGTTWHGSVYSLDSK